MKTEQIAPGVIFSEAEAWAVGCDGCRYGLIDPPPITGYGAPLWVARAFQWHFGYLAVCDCKAGQAYTRFLQRAWNRIEDKTEHIPLTWSTAIHTQLRARDEPPDIRAVHGMEVD